MSVRKRGNRWAIYVYDPERRDNVYIGSEPYTREGKRTADRRFAEEVEKRTTTSRRREKADSFARRWTEDYPRKSERTNRNYRERIKKFAEDFADRYLDDIDVPEADRWARANPGRLHAVRAMFTDARRLGYVKTNPFAKLGLEGSEGRRRVEPPTLEELHLLGDLCIETHGEAFGRTFRAAMIASAFIGWRAGEMAGAWWSDVHTDEIDIFRQYDASAGSFVPPKTSKTGHTSSGTVYLPREAKEALRDVPRRVGDEVIFRTLDGAMLSGSTLSYWLAPVRAAYVAKATNPEVVAQRKRLTWHQFRHFCATYLLNVKHCEPWVIAEQMRHDDGGTLVTQLYGHPSKQVAREQIRRAFGSNVRSIEAPSGADREQAHGA